MKNKTPLITPLLMLTAGAIASIIMYVRGFEFNRMLWDLLIVLVIFYIIGDIVRYIYAYLRPRTIPPASIDSELIDALMNGEDAVGNVVAVSDGNDADTDGDLEEGTGVQGLVSDDASGYYDEDGYSDDELGGDDD